MPAPTTDEVEVSLFGPGYGESIAIHLPGGTWAVVDSCLDEHGQPAALAYLHSLGVDLDRVILIVVTHWHDDHIRGISEIARQCQRASIAFAENLKSDELLILAQLANETVPVAVGDGIGEFRKLLGLLAQRKKAGHDNGTPKFCGPDRVLHREGSTEVWSLSPSDEARLRLMAQLVEARAAVQARRRIASPKPNQSAVALLVKTEVTTILLGADLEERNNELCGWTAILNSTGRPRDTAEIFKIPHHGSETAHHDRVWTEMVRRPISLVTPFVNGNVALPTEPDVRRIVPASSKTFVSSATKLKVPKFSDPALRRAISEASVSLTASQPPCGHVRARKKAASDWVVERFNGAFEATLAS